jgi:hypothetical protein
MRSLDLSLDGTGLLQQPAEQLSRFGLVKASDDSSALLQQLVEHVSRLSRFSSADAQGAALGAQDESIEPQWPEFIFFNEDCPSFGAWSTFGLPQQPLEQVLVSLASLFVAGLCGLTKPDFSGLQQPPDLASLPVGAHCLAALGRSNEPQQPLEQAAVSLMSLFVTEACCLDNEILSALLQQPPELRALHLLVGAHCLATLGGPGEPQ